jgi:hypothetical protein
MKFELRYQGGECIPNGVTEETYLGSNFDTVVDCFNACETLAQSNATEQQAAGLPAIHCDHFLYSDQTRSQFLDDGVTQDPHWQGDSGSHG